VIVLMVSVGFLSLYAHYRAARATEDLDNVAGERAGALAWIDQQVSTLDDPQALLDGVKGTVWSMRLGGLDLSDPLAAAETVAASKQLYVPMLLSALVPVVVTVLLGRVFCSWICPAGLLFEITGKLRRLLRIAELPPAEVHFSHRNKYVVLVVGLLTAALLGLPIFTLIYPPAVLSRLAHAWIFGTALTGMLVLLGVMVVFELLVSPRWWCRTMCPGGALYALLGWSRLLRVKLDASRCTGCRACEPVCEPGLDPVRQSYGIECDNCGVCIRHCGDQALYYTIGLPLRPSTSRKNRRFSTKATATAGASAALLFLVLPATPVSGHHILGLPHYSYKENYPQAPTLEYPATTGPYDVLLTSYPGKPVPNEAATLAIYIKNGVTGTPYDQPISLRVLETYTFGRSREILPTTRIPAYEVPHKCAVTFPEDGEYVVELTMDVEGKPEVIGFLLVAGNPTAIGSIVTAVAVGLGLFIIVVRAVRIKRDRRARASTTPVPAMG
jgi:ferredoxin-type protein NapH